MNFAYPALAAVLLLALPLGAWAVFRFERRRQTRLDDFGAAGLLAHASALPSARRRFARHFLWLGAMAFGVVALARPQFGQRAGSLAETGRDVLVLLDLSRSMNASDGKGARLSLAKEAVAQVLAGSAGNRFGLVVFGGSAFLQLPLTADHAAFRRFLDAATTDDISNPATDLSRALAAAATAFEHEGERGFQTVLLVSDGESVEGDVGPALKRLRAARVPVLAIGVGTLEGAPVPADSADAPEKWHRDHIGRVVLSRLEEGDLRRAAQETNGVYVRWAPGAAANLNAELARLEQRVIASRTSPELADRFQWPLGLAILLLAAEPMLAVRLRSRA